MQYCVQTTKNTAVAASISLDKYKFNQLPFRAKSENV